MKAILLAFVFLAIPVGATTVQYVTVKMPVWLADDGDDKGIEILDVSVLSPGSEATYSAICRAFAPPSLASWAKPENVNIAFQYGISVSLDYGREAEPPHWIITVDATAAKKPEGYSFTIEQVTDAVMTCVKLMTPIVPEDERKVTIKVLPAKK